MDILGVGYPKIEKVKMCHRLLIDPGPGDVSERAYGAISYLRVTDEEGRLHVSFILARSCVAPKRQSSMSRLDVSAALSSAQLADDITCGKSLACWATFPEGTRREMAITSACLPSLW